MTFSSWPIGPRGLNYQNVTKSYSSFGILGSLGRGFGADLRVFTFWQFQTIILWQIIGYSNTCWYKYLFISYSFHFYCYKYLWTNLIKSWNNNDDAHLGVGKALLAAHLVQPLVLVVQPQLHQLPPCTQYSYVEYQIFSSQNKISMLSCLQWSRLGNFK